MFTAEQLQQMTREQLVDAAAGVGIELSELSAKHRRSERDEDRLIDLNRDYRQLSGALGRLNFADARSNGDRSFALSGEDGMRHLDGSAVPGYEPRESGRADALGGLRSRAMRQLDAAVRANTMRADAAGVYERLIGTGSLPERSWVARYVEAAGSPEYLSAFQKRLIDPEGARDRFSAAEVEAVRRVYEVAEERAMSTVDSSGGFLIPAQLDPAILLSSSGFQNPIRAMARTVQVTGDAWHGVSSDGASARWAAEGTEAGDNSPAVAQPVIPVYKADSFVPYSVEVEGDGAGFVEEVSRLMVDAIDNLWATAFVTGSGTGEPTGFVTALAGAGGSIVVSGGGSEALANGDPVKLQNALPPRAQPNSAWAMALPTINQLRFAETTNGALLYPSLQNDVPTLLGRRVFEISTMDGVVNPAATQANYLIALGDWSRFVIADRVGTRVELIPHLVGANRRPTGQRGFYAWFRTGSDVLTTNSFRLLNVPTTA